MSHTQNNTKPQSSKTSLLRKVLNLEVRRYQEKGMYLPIALGIVISWIALSPELGKEFWPKVLIFMEQYKVEKWQFAFFFTYGYNVLFYALCNVVLYFLYSMNSPSIERFKIIKDEKWPWQENKEQWLKTLKHTLKVVMVNHLVVLPCVMLVGLWLSNFEVMQSFEVEDLPTSFTMAWQILFMMLLEDFYFHFAHRLLHHRLVYPYIHKVHHQYTVSVGISATYAHPLEFIFGNMAPTVIPFTILGPNLHFFTGIMHISQKLLNSIIQHSGYEFPWNPIGIIPFQAYASYHDYHHSANIGNYSGSFIIWDFLLGGVNKSYFEFYEDKPLVNIDFPEKLE